MRVVRPRVPRGTEVFAGPFANIIICARRPVCTANKTRSDTERGGECSSCSDPTRGGLNVTRRSVTAVDRDHWTFNDSAVKSNGFWGVFFFFSFLSHDEWAPPRTSSRADHNNRRRGNFFFDTWRPDDSLTVLVTFGVGFESIVYETGGSGRRPTESWCLGTHLFHLKPVDVIVSRVYSVQRAFATHGRKAI